MIYIFQGCKFICDIPSQVCEGCAQACDAACKGICDPIAECCSSICDGISHVCERPLGCYVIYTIFSSLLTFLAVILAFVGGQDMFNSWDTSSTTAAPGQVAPATGTSTSSCSKLGMLVLFLVGAFVIALINICFAVYVQSKIWEGLVDLVDEEEAEAVQSGQPVRRRNVGQLIMDSAGTVALYDIAFCLYFFFLLAQLAFFAWGITIIRTHGCNVSGWPGVVAYLGISYPIIVFMWVFLWWVFLCLHSCMEDVCRPFGGCSCCFGKRPNPRGQPASYDESDDEDDYVYPVGGGYAYPMAAGAAAGAAGMALGRKQGGKASKGRRRKKTFCSIL